MKARIKQIVKAAYSRVLPRGARNSLRLFLSLDSPDRAPVLISDFAAKSVVVLAPHMDDEVIGCGGTVRRHVLAGSRVTVVFMTDGRKGDPELYGRGLSREQIDAAETAMVSVRKTESRGACALLGITDLVFLDGPDGKLGETEALISALFDVLKSRQPQFVYLPAMTDLHSDHWATNRIFNAATSKLPANIARPVVRGYEVWTPVIANAMVDITEVVEDKRQAIEFYVSQTKFVDYSRVTLALNIYRSIMHLAGKGYAEAFFEANAEDYAKVCEAIVMKRR